MGIDILISEVERVHHSITIIEGGFFLTKILQWSEKTAPYKKTEFPRVVD